MQQELTGLQSFKMSFLIQTTETQCISEQADNNPENDTG